VLARCDFCSSGLQELRVAAGSNGIQSSTPPTWLIAEVRNAEDSSSTLELIQLTSHAHLRRAYSVQLAGRVRAHVKPMAIVFVVDNASLRVYAAMSCDVDNVGYRRAAGLHEH
jgi:hypothetical protein